MRLPGSRIAYVVYAAIALTSISVASNFYARPRPWSVAEVPITFWSWRHQAPSQVDVLDAIEKTRATKLFLRAGQIDYHDERPNRIRALSGSFPRNLELHLVYNATRALLDQFEKADPASVANAVASAYKEDLERASRVEANVRGLQLDFDIATRLLPRYEKTLLALRAALPRDTQLSITGLPTWMESSALDQLLEHVDFWVPQFYGADIPQRVEQLIPISSPQSITHFVKRARLLNRPFFAGLSAYSVAILYSSSSALVNLRGDMNPATIASDRNLELIDRRNFDDQSSGEWRYVFRARADGVTDGLAMRAGDFLIVDVPSSASLRTAARIVRQEAGERLLGICIFRLPAREDPATLSIDQVQAALTDQVASAQVEVHIKRATNENNYTLELRNTGTASAILGTINVDLNLAPGSFNAASTSAETLCTDVNSTHPCSQMRANLISLNPVAIGAGQTAKVFFGLRRESPQTVAVSVRMLTDTGDTYTIHRDVKVE